MGTLSCQRCGAVALANTQEEADDLIDHARGQMIGRPCEGKQSDLHWTSDTRKETVAPKIVVAENITESKKSQNKKKSKKG